MDQTYEDMVANFMARFLDMNLSNVTGPGRQTPGVGVWEGTAGNHPKLTWLVGKYII